MEHNLKSLDKEIRTFAVIKKNADSVKFDGAQIIIKFKFPTTITIGNRFFGGIKVECFFAKGTKNISATGYLGELIYTIDFEDTKTGWESVINFINGFKD